MSVFDNIGKKVSEAAQSASKKSTDIYETTKLNRSIGKEKDEIKELLFALGEKYYALYASESVAQPLDDICTAIKQHEKNIADLQEQIQMLEQENICSNCGSQLEADSVFCVNCGHKVSDDTSEDLSKNQ